MLLLRFNLGDEHPSSKKIWTTGVTKQFSTVQFLLWQIASKWWHWVGMVLLALAFFQTWMHAGNPVSLLRTQQLGGHILLHSNSSKKDEGTLPIFLPSQIPSPALQTKGLNLIPTQLNQKNLKPAIQESRRPGTRFSCYCRGHWKQLLCAVLSINVGGGIPLTPGIQLSCSTSPLHLPTWVGFKLYNFIKPNSSPPRSKASSTQIHTKAPASCPICLPHPHLQYLLFTSPVLLIQCLD